VHRIAIAGLLAAGLLAGEPSTTETTVVVYGTRLVVTAPSFPRSPELVRLLDQSVSVDFQDTEFEDAVAFLRQHCQVNFIIGPDIRAQAPRVNLVLEKVPLAAVLRWMRTVTRVDYHLLDGAVYFTNQPISGPRSVRIYDVADVVLRIPHFEGPVLDLAAGANGAGMQLPAEPAMDSPWSTEELADIIRTSLAAD
jgi:hypothetical protein